MVPREMQGHHRTNIAIVAGCLALVAGVGLGRAYFGPHDGAAIGGGAALLLCVVAWLAVALRNWRPPS